MKIMTPKSEAELSDLLSSADSPLLVQGGGTRGIDLPGDRLSTTDLSGVSLYEPGALTLVAGAGTPLREIEAVLQGEGQRLAFEPMDCRKLLGTNGEPTIGGVVAANQSGPRRIQAGACRDHLLGVRYVDGTGTIIRNGGRVMKNVTGYDLVKLMAGSWGTLGVLTEVALKVLPHADTEETVLIGGCDAQVAVRAMSAALGSPFEVSGAAFDPAADRVLIRIEGFAESVSYRAERLSALLNGFGAVGRSGEAESRQLWADLRDVARFHDRPGDVWRLSVKPSDAPEIAARLEADGVLYDWGGGLIWALMPEGTDLRTRAGRFNGHATLVRARAQDRARLGMFHPEPEAIAAISAGLRARFDPRGVLNPGLMGRPEPVGA